MISINNLTIKHNHILLDNIHCEFYQGAVHLIKGSSGSGKTSLLYRLSLINQNYDYDYFIGNKNISQLSKREINSLKRYSLSYILQDNLLLDHFDVKHNLMHNASIVNKKLKDNDINHYLKMVHLDVPLKQSITTLSGGERQRLSIACGLVKGSKVMIFDEPTSALDKDNEINIFKLLQELAHKYNKCIIVASHSSNAIEYSNFIYEIIDKKLVIQKMCDIKDNFEIEKIKNSHLPSSFYFTYIKSFFKKYKSLQIIIIFSMLFSNILMSMCQIYLDKEQQNSINTLRQISDCQLLISSNDKNNPFLEIPITQYNNFSQIQSINKIYPYYKVITYINGMNVSVIPYYPENNIIDKIETSYKNNGIFVSYPLYYELKTVTNDIKLDFIAIRIKNNKVHNEIVTKTIPIDGIIKRNVENCYEGNQYYIMMPFNQLNQLFNTKNHYNEYSYSIFTNDFIGLYNAKEQIKDMNLIINDTFQNIDALKDVETSYTTINQYMNGSIIFISILLFSILNYHYLKKRKKEFCLLKINGISHTQILILTIFEYIIKIIPMVCICILLSYYFNNFILQQSLILGIEYCIFIMITFIINASYLNKLNIEKILRD